MSLACTIAQPTVCPTIAVIATSAASAKSRTVFARLEFAPETAACTYIAPSTRKTAPAKMRTEMCRVLRFRGRVESASR